MSRLLTLMQYFLVMLLRGSQDLISSRRGRRRNQHRTRRVCSTAWGSTRRAQTRHRRSRGNFPEWCSERWGASLCLGLARFNTGVHVTSLTKHLVERTQSLRDDQRAVNYVLHEANINGCVRRPMAGRRRCSSLHRRRSRLALHVKRRWASCRTTPSCATVLLIRAARSSCTAPLRRILRTPSGRRWSARARGRSATTGATSPRGRTHQRT